MPCEVVRAALVAAALGTTPRVAQVPHWVAPSARPTPPVVDMALMVHAYESSKPLPREGVNAIADACSRWGFFYVVGHGVPDDLIDEFYEQKRRFFALPKEVKSRVKRNAENSKGWYDDELTKNKVDWKEGFDIGAQDGSLDARGLDGVNQWPDSSFGLPDFEGTCRAFFSETNRVARVLVRAMSAGLGMPEDHFDKDFERHTSYLRLNYYPTCPRPKDHMCISPHTDAGAVTVLTHSPVQSLQVESGGQWFDVPPVPGSFVINTGDVMQVWSNGLYKAPLHRVIAHEDNERYSSPFFYNPNYDTDYAPISACVTPDRPPKYRPINWGNFRMARFAGDFADVGTETQISDFEIY